MGSTTLSMATNFSANSAAAKAEQMLGVVQRLEPNQVFSTHLSKLAPAVIKNELNRIPTGVDTVSARVAAKSSVCFGSALANFYGDDGVNNCERSVCNLARTIQDVAKCEGIMGVEGAPMERQEALHATISSVILDKPNEDDVARCFGSLRQSAARFGKLLSSDVFRDIKLELTELKFLPDGNMGFQFHCDKTQDVALSVEALLAMVEKKRKNLSEESIKALMKKLDNPKNGILCKDGQSYTFSRLQFLRLKVALLGGEVKAWYPGTLMVIGWVRDAKTLKHREGLKRFLERASRVTNDFILKSPVHALSNIYENLSEARTLDKRFGVSLRHKGELVKLMRVEWLLSRALMPKSIVLVHSAGAEFNDDYLDPDTGNPCPHDPDLCETGTRKSREFGRVLRNMQERFPDFLDNFVVLSSPMRRSVKTAINIVEQISANQTSMLNDGNPAICKKIFVETSLCKAGWRLNSLLVDGDHSAKGRLGEIFRPAKAWGRMLPIEIAKEEDQFGLGRLRYENSIVEVAQNSGASPVGGVQDRVTESYQRFPKDGKVSDFQERCNRLVGAMQSSPGLAQKNVVLVTHREVFGEISRRVFGSKGAPDLAKQQDMSLPKHRVVHLTQAVTGEWRPLSMQPPLKSAS